MKTSAAGRKDIEGEEGCVLRAYPDPGTGGEPWTIGFGNTGLDVGPGTVWTQAQADAALTRRLAQEFEPSVNSLGVDLTQAEFDACVSLCYNIGTGGFKGSETASYLKAGDHYKAAAAFMGWDRPSMLIPRRYREIGRFLGGKDAVTAFQKAHGLTADGVVGPMTIEALKTATERKAA